jgi:hypothetical protein
MQLSSALDLKVPRIVGSSRNYEATCKREYSSNTHLYFIHSVSVCSDEATFLTADDLSVYLWDLERADSSLQAVDIRPTIPDEHDVRSPILQPYPRYVKRTLHSLEFARWFMHDHTSSNVDWRMCDLCTGCCSGPARCCCRHIRRHECCTVIEGCTQCLHGHFHSHSNAWAPCHRSWWFQLFFVQPGNRSLAGRLRWGYLFWMTTTPSCSIVRWTKPLRRWIGLRWPHSC